MNKHDELRNKLDGLNEMGRAEASSVVTEILKYVMDSIQPERSKREDFCLTGLANQYIHEWEPHPSDYVELDEAYIKGVYDFSDWLKKRCGALNIVETQ
jgi:hypothetical protein